MVTVSNVKHTNANQHVNENEISTTLPSGKEIVFKKDLTLGEIVKFSFYFGKFADNKEFYGFARGLSLVKKFNGNPISFPHTESEIFQIADMIGIEGLEAINESVLGTQITDEEVKQEIKK